MSSEKEFAEFREYLKTRGWSYEQIDSWKNGRLGYIPLIERFDFGWEVWQAARESEEDNTSEESIGHSFMKFKGADE